MSFSRAKADAPNLNLVDKMEILSPQLNRDVADRATAQLVLNHLREILPEEDTEKLMVVALCESNFNPNAKNSANTNGSSDGGVFQINSVHDVTHNELVNPKTNTDVAISLYKESSLRPWTSSRDCWSKGLSILKTL